MLFSTRQAAALMGPSSERKACRRPREGDDLEVPLDYPKMRHKFWNLGDKAYDAPTCGGRVVERLQGREQKLQQQQQPSQAKASKLFPLRRALASTTRERVPESVGKVYYRLITSSSGPVPTHGGPEAKQDAARMADEQPQRKRLTLKPRDPEAAKQLELERANSKKVGGGPMRPRAGKGARSPDGTHGAQGRRQGWTASHVEASGTQTGKA